MMTTRAQRYDAVVTRREQVSTHLVRLTLSVPGFASTGIPDEWVGLVVPGQFQVRYYTVRSVEGDGLDDELVLDVVVHAEGLVTEWASGDCLGDPVVRHRRPGLVRAPAGRRVAAPGRRPDRDAGDGPDLGGATTGPRHAIWAEVPDDLSGYFPAGIDVTWLEPPGEGQSRLAEVVEGIDWPEARGTSGWRVSRRRCARSAST